MTTPLNIWCPVPNAADPIRKLFPQHRILDAVDALLPEAEIIYGHVDRTKITLCRRLRWIHIPNANYARYDKPEFWAALRTLGAVMTNSSSALADPCAQHMLAMMMGMARRLPHFAGAQARRQWQDPPDGQCHVLTRSTGLILGFGAIARRLVELLGPFEMNLTTVRRTVRGDEPIPAFTESELPRLIPQADHLINVLPISNATHHFVNAERLALAKPTAFFYNVGRGATVDQDALRHALSTARLAGAYLDVVEPEPLPPDNPLWTTPNLFITPHSASLHPARNQQVFDHFIANLRRFLTSEPLLDRLN